MMWDFLFRNADQILSGAAVAAAYLGITRHGARAKEIERALANALRRRVLELVTDKSSHALIRRRLSETAREAITVMGIKRTSAIDRMIDHLIDGAENKANELIIARGLAGLADGAARVESSFR